MRSRKGIASLLFAWACAGAFGCASAPPPPPDWLPSPEETQSSPFGGWVEIEHHSPRGELRFSGELLAVQDERVYILQGDAVKSVPIDSVTKAKLTWYDSQAGGVAAGAVLGTVTTLSNGFYLVFTAPMWIIGGSVATHQRSRDPIIATPKQAWSEFVPYARFPQGLPADFVPRAPAPVTEPVVAEPAPVETPVTPPARAHTEWGLAFGVGAAHNLDQNDIAMVLGLNVSKKWVSAGVRFSLGDRDPFLESGEPDGDAVFDLGFMIGVRGKFRGLQMAARAGPAAWGLDLGDLEDVRSSFAAQGELFFYPFQNVGFGTMVAYNANSYRDYTIVTLGIAFGPR